MVLLADSDWGESARAIVVENTTIARIIHQAILSDRKVLVVRFIGLNFCVWIVVVDNSSWFCGRLSPVTDFFNKRDET